MKKLASLKMEGKCFEILTKADEMQKSVCCIGWS